MPKSQANNPTKPKQPKRKPQPKKRKAKGLMSIKASTINQVQNKLMNLSMNHNSSVSGYLSCRLNPFHATNGRGIPDGANSNYIVIDHLMIDNIVDTASAGFTIQTVPMLPATSALAVAAGVNTLTINGIPYVGSATQFLAQYPLGFAPPYLTVGTQPGIVTNDPYQSTKARLVSCAYRLIYTGQSALASGTIIVTPNDVGLTVSQQSAAGIFPYTSNTNLQANAGNYTNGAIGLNMDIANANNAFVKDSYISRVEAGAYVLPKHRSRDFKLSATVDSPYVPIANSTGTSNSVNFFSSTSGAPASGVLWYDDDWSSASIQVSGYPAGSSFQLQTAFCMEYSVSNTSAFANLANKQSDFKPADIELSNKQTNSLPAATPASGSSTKRP